MGRDARTARRNTMAGRMGSEQGRAATAALPPTQSGPNRARQRHARPTPLSPSRTRTACMYGRGADGWGGRRERAAPPPTSMRPPALPRNRRTDSATRRRATCRSARRADTARTTCTGDSRRRRDARRDRAGSRGVSFVRSRTARAQDGGFPRPFPSQPIVRIVHQDRASKGKQSNVREGGQSAGAYVFQAFHGWSPVILRRPKGRAHLRRRHIHVCLNKTSAFSCLPWHRVSLKSVMC